MFGSQLKSFKLFIESLKGDDALFEAIFTELCSNGHYGWDIDVNLIRDEQYRWFKTFKKLLETKDYESIVYVMKDKNNNKISKEFFSRITGFDLTRKSTQYIEQTVREYCDMGLNKKTVVYEWNRYINMTPDEVEKESQEKVRANYFLEKLKNYKKKEVEEYQDSEIDWMAKHLRLLKQVKDSKIPLKNVNGEPTKKFNFLKMLGCNPNCIKNG